MITASQERENGRDEAQVLKTQAAQLEQQLATQAELHAMTIASALGGSMEPEPESEQLEPWLHRALQQQIGAEEGVPPASAATGLNLVPRTPQAGGGVQLDSALLRAVEAHVEQAVDRALMNSPSARLLMQMSPASSPLPGNRNVKDSG